MWNNGFNCPHSKRYTDITEPFNDVDLFNWSVVVKPVDSAGSKGVTKCDKPDEFSDAIQIALQGSHNDAFALGMELFGLVYHEFDGHW